MNKIDWMKAQDKAESLSELILLDVIGFSKPWTAVTLGFVLIMAGVGAVFIWNLL